MAGLARFANADVLFILKSAAREDGRMALAIGPPAARYAQGSRTGPTRSLGKNSSAREWTSMRSAAPRSAASASPGAMLPLSRDAAIAEAGRRALGTAGSNVPDPPDAPHHFSGRITQAGVTAKGMEPPATGGAALGGDGLSGERRAERQALVAAARRLVN